MEKCYSAIFYLNSYPVFSYEFFIGEDVNSQYEAEQKTKELIKLKDPDEYDFGKLYYQEVSKATGDLLVNRFIKKLDL